MRGLGWELLGFFVSIMVIVVAGALALAEPGSLLSWAALIVGLALLALRVQGFARWLASPYRHVKRSQLR